MPTKRELIQDREDGSKEYRVTGVAPPKTARQKQHAAKFDRIQKDLEKNQQDAPTTGAKARRKRQRIKQTLQKKRGRLGLSKTQSGPKQVSEEAAQLIQERRKLRDQGAVLASRISAQLRVDKAQ